MLVVLSPRISDDTRVCVMQHNNSTFHAIATSFHLILFKRHRHLQQQQFRIVIPPR